MAGYRRSRAASAPDQTLQPRQRDVRADRARRRRDLRYAKATTEVERLAVYTDHVRLVATRAGRMDSARADHVVRELRERAHAAACELERIAEGKR